MTSVEPSMPRASLLTRILRLARGDASGAVFKNMIVLSMGAGAARLIGLLSIPILTRIYVPEDFGLLAVFTSLVALMVPFATLRYVQAIPLPKTDRMAANVVALSALILLCFGVLQALVLVSVGSILLPMLSAEQLVPYVWLVVVGTIAQSGYELLSQWSTRKKAFKMLARSQASQAILGNGVKIGLGVASLGPLGLLIGQIFWLGGGVVVMGRNMLKDIRSDVKHIGWRAIRFLTLRYSDFPRFQLPSRFLLTFSTQAPVLFSAALFGAATTGQLSLAILALALPMQMLGNATGSAYYGEIAALGKRNPELIRSVTAGVIKRLLLLSIVPCAILLFFGEPLFVLLLGEKWAQAGLFAGSLAIYLAMQFVSSPLVHVMSVFNRQDLYLRINIIRAAGVLLVFGAAHFWQWNAHDTIMVYSVALTAHMIFSIFQTMRVIPSKTPDP